MVKIQSGEHKDMVDLTHLKAYFAANSVQQHNPTLFKKINDMALQSEFKGKITQEEFKQLFLNSKLLQDRTSAPPGLEEIASLFEFLDSDRTGFITSANLREYL